MFDIILVIGDVLHCDVVILQDWNSFFKKNHHMRFFLNEHRTAKIHVFHFSCSAFYHLYLNALFRRYQLFTCFPSLQYYYYYGKTPTSKTVQHQINLNSSSVEDHVFSVWVEVKGQCESQVLLGVDWNWPRIYLCCTKLMQHNGG